MSQSPRVYTEQSPNGEGSLERRNLYMLGDL